MKQLLLVVTIGWLSTAPLSADTRTGSANPQTLQAWSFTASGPVNIVLSWTKAAIDVDMILVCGTADPQVVGIDVGAVDWRSFRLIRASQPAC